MYVIFIMIYWITISFGRRRFCPVSGQLGIDVLAPRPPFSWCLLAVDLPRASSFLDESTPEMDWHWRSSPKASSKWERALSPTKTDDVSHPIVDVEQRDWASYMRPTLRRIMRIRVGQVVFIFNRFLQ